MESSILSGKLSSVRGENPRTRISVTMRWRKAGGAGDGVMEAAETELVTDSLKLRPADHPFGA